jgi:transcription-repair coupling factor (superfamily II helicase)
MLNPEKNRIENNSDLKTIIEKIGVGSGEICVNGLYGSSKSLFISAVFKKTQKPLVIVSPDYEEAQRLYQDLSQFINEAEIVLLPAWDIFSTDILSAQRDTELRRINALFRLYTGEISIFILPLNSFLQKVAPKEAIDAYVRKIAIGDMLDRDEFTAKLEAGGYRRASIVEEQGEYSVRGHVIDLFTPIAANPFRLLFVGDELESIKEFDSESQRSIQELVDFVLPPARELILTEESRKNALKNMKDRANDLDLPRTVKDRLSDIIGNGLGASINPLFLPLFYGDLRSPNGLDGISRILPDRAILMIGDGTAIAGAEEKLASDLDRILDKARQENRFYLEKESLYSEKSDLLLASGHLPTIRIQDLEIGDQDGGPERTIRFHTETHIGLKREVAASDREDGALKPLASKLRTWLDQGNLIAFLCAGDEEINRISHLLEKYALPITRSGDPLLSELERHSGQGSLILRDGKLSGGFNFPALKFITVSDEEIFGKKVRRRKPKSVSEGYFLKSFGELKEGDPVVHTEHGIGMYRGLEKLEISGIENDFLWIEYLDGDKLFIPVDRLDQIQRYIGSDGQEIRLDKLGGTAWETAKKKARRSAEEIAEELVAIYAAREVMERKAFHPTDEYYEEFASSFEYEETPDQAKAIEEINADMDENKPMDRLICGDAGFGKTEIAIRAAFRAVMDGKQAAVLVPTTILSEQHYQTFRKRLQGYPIRIEALNRFKTRKEQTRITEDTAKGQVDILIGTHRILQADVEFKNLGLVIIDEEQRFGVNHKEKLKKLRTLVDVLTLSATPIPRTLELSLVGLRDLSMINTPPVDRQAIKTYVLEFDRETIAKAIRRELSRGGQVFFLHDRIHSIRGMERFIKEMVPEARVVIAHGRMKPKELEDVMVKFIRGEYDILLCTTIIGSGIDIPSTNTIIINRADRFGLSQLYQLRGRVGRSKEEAYAYLLIPRGAVLAPDARKRLQVVKDFTEPGSGFRIAAQDLEIRGAGNLLGSSQSGHIAAVGYELYIQLLESTIRELKGEKPSVADELRPEIHLGIPAFIPEEYIPDMNRRLTMYKRISTASSESELAEIRTELEDTCGFLATQTENLLQVIGIRNMLKSILGKKLEFDGKNIQIAFHQESPIDPGKIIRLAQAKNRKVKFTPDLKLRVSVPPTTGTGILDEARNLIRELMN